MSDFYTLTRSFWPSSCRDLTGCLEPEHESLGADINLDRVCRFRGCGAVAVWRWRRGPPV